MTERNERQRKQRRSERRPIRSAVKNAENSAAEYATKAANPKKKIGGSYLMAPGKQLPKSEVGEDERPAEKEPNRSI